MPILHKKSKRKKKRQKDGVELSNRGVNTFTSSPLATADAAFLDDNFCTTTTINTILPPTATTLHSPPCVGFVNSESLGEYDLNRPFPVSCKSSQNIAPFHHSAADRMKNSKKWRISSRFKFKDCGSEGNVKSDEVMMDGPTSALRQEVLKHIIARRALESEKAELTRHLAQRDSLICDLRKQLLQKEKALQQQRNQFEEAIRNIQNGKPFRPFRGESPSAGRTQGREELQLVREAISALRSNFRGTDPNQHTLDTLEQAIAVLMERNSISNGDCNNVGVTKKEKRALNAQTELYTKVIYFTDRTVTPFMTCINKRLGEVTLRDFKNIFDRSGNFRFHFKSHDPEYGLVKEEIMNDDDTLPGVEGKIIAWVEEDLE